MSSRRAKRSGGGPGLARAKSLPLAVAEPLHPRDPRRIGAYRAVGRLGQGGMGVVYLAEGPGKSPVALKVIRPELAADEGFRRRFRHEIENASRVSGLCTARVLGGDAGAEQPFLATEYVPGPTLDEFVNRQGPLHGEALKAFAVGLAEALVAIHGAGIIHRDLKPSNVVLSTEGPRVIDFGIARAADATPITGTGMSIGTPAWMAPEQARWGRAEPASDVFAWGALVAYAATGRPPFGLGAPEEVLYRLVHEEPDIRHVPRELKPLVDATLLKEPANRPTSQSILETLLGPDAIATVPLREAAGEVITRTWPVTLATTAADALPRSRRLLPLVLAASIILLLFIGGLGFVFLRDSAVPPGPANPSLATAEPSQDETSPTSPTASPPATESPPEPSETEIHLTRVFEFSGGALQDEYEVVDTTSGSCTTNSFVSNRPDAWRCFAAGSLIYDPCFQPVGTVAEEVACPSAPWSKEVVMIELRGALPSAPLLDQEDILGGPPWGVHLIDGPRCSYLSGATGEIAGLRLNYGCGPRGNDGFLVGEPERRGRTWSMFFARTLDEELVEVEIAEAWF